MKKLSIFLALLSLTAITQASEKRCGWLENPTPSNWWLIDGEGEWTISTQGGDQPDESSWDHLPKTNENEFVRTNGSYGYSCVCLTVTVNKAQQRILKIQGGKSLLLKQCLEDTALPSMKR